MPRPHYEDFGLSISRVQEIRRTISFFATKKEALKAFIGMRQYFKYISMVLLLIYVLGILTLTMDTFVVFTKDFMFFATAPFVVYLVLHFVLLNKLEKYNPEKVPDYREYMAFEAEVQKYEEEKKREVQKYVEEQKRLEIEKTRLAELKRKRFWLKQDAYTFEKSIAEIFERLGHKVRLTKSSGDGGVDIFAEEDIVIQCKATKSQTPPAVVRELYGAMHHCKAKKGIIVSTGGFTSGCYQFARGKNIELWDLTKLLEVAGKLSIGYKSN